MEIPVTLETIRQAAGRIAPYAELTPVLKSRSLDEASGATVFLKCENFQKIGAFKFRGAMNAVLTLDEEQRRRGVSRTARATMARLWPGQGRSWVCQFAW